MHGAQPPLNSNPSSLQPRSLWSVLEVGGKARLSLLGGLGAYAASQLLILRAIETQLPESRSGTEIREMLWFLFAILVVHVSYRYQLSVGSRRVVSAVAALCEDIVSRIAKLNLQDFEALDQNALHACLVEDRGHVESSSSLIIEVVATLAITVFIAAYSVLISPLWGMLVSGALVLLSGRILYLQGRQGTYSSGRGPTNRLPGFLTFQITSGFKEIRQHRGRRESIQDAHQVASLESHQARAASLERYYEAESVGRTGFYALLGACAFVLPMVNWNDTETSARLMLCLFFQGGAIRWLWMSGFPRILRTNEAWSRIVELQQHIASIEPQRESSDTIQFDRLSMEDVHYHHPGSGLVSGPYDLEIKSGEVIWISGGNGSGKTTLLMLLAGLYVPIIGQMVVNGLPVNVATTSSYRTLLSLVLPDKDVRREGFEETLPEETVAHWLKELGLEDVVWFSKGRLHAGHLSPSQRARLVLLDAILLDRPMLLFDEWTARLDLSSRRTFFRRILPALRAKGKTIIAVSHAEEWSTAADRRIHLETGKIVPCSPE